MRKEEEIKERLNRLYDIEDWQDEDWQEESRRTTGALIDLLEWVLDETS